MESIIKKAIEGGYIPKYVNWYEDECLNGRLSVCDPLFWKSLGKAYGWASICSQCGKAEKPHEYLHIYRPSRLEEVCVDKALRFHEINLTEGWEKAVEYLQEVTK